MNIKLKNLRSAEEELGKFLGNIVVSSELATAICGDEVNDSYLEYVIELNNKVTSAPVVCCGGTCAVSMLKPPVFQTYFTTVLYYTVLNRTVLLTSLSPNDPCPSSSNTSGRLKQHRMAPV